MAWVGGGFSDSGFSTGFNIGTQAAADQDETMAPPDRLVADKFRHYERVKREDDEILTFILNAVTSGVLDS